MSYANTIIVGEVGVGISLIGVNKGIFVYQFMKVG